MRTTGPKTVAGDKTFSNDIVVRNFTVSGTTTTINTETINLEDNIILLNSGTSGVLKTQDCKLTEVLSADVLLQFNETTDKWQFTNDGSTYYTIASSDELAEVPSNLYYNQARADARADARFDVKIAAADKDPSEGPKLIFY